MQELAFTVEFDRGADDLMDLFREFPTLEARSSVCVTTRRTMWRIDHVTGPDEALERFDERFLDESRCNECLDTPQCRTNRKYHVLDETPDSRTVYTFRREVQNCHSVPYIVVDHVGDGVVFEARRTGAEYRWKALFPDEQPVGELFDAIEANLRGGLSLSLSRLTQSGNWSAESRIEAELSHKHREALRAAVDAGYYDRPREVTVADLAEDLDLPRSTVQYRLRSAEDVIVERFVERTI